jgi:hypothetical protein
MPGKGYIHEKDERESNSVAVAVADHGWLAKENSAAGQVTWMSIDRSSGNSLRGG